jgi:hypothetical protein
MLGLGWGIFGPMGALQGYSHVRGEFRVRAGGQDSRETPAVGHVRRQFYGLSAGERPDQSVDAGTSSSSKRTGLNLSRETSIASQIGIQEQPF